MKFIILFVISFSSIYAETKYLIINGGYSKSANRTTYFNQSKHAYDKIKSKGNDVRVLTADGSWNHSDTIDTNGAPPIQSKATSLKDIENAIESLELKSSDNLVIYFTGHGDVPNTFSKDEDDPHKNASYSLWGKSQISWEAISNSLSNSNANKIKVVTDVCNGGGAHYISQQLDNACSVSSVPYYMKSSSGVEKEGLFSNSFWENYDSDKSLKDLSLKAFEEDMGNPGMGSISSFDYIDYILDRGQYTEDSKYRTVEAQNTSVSYIKERYNEDLLYFKDNYLEQTFGINAQALHNDCYHCIVDDFEEMTTNIENLLFTSSSLSKGLIRKYYPDIISFAEKFVEEKDYYRKLFQKLSSKERLLKQEYRSLTKSYSDSNTLIKWVVDYDDRKKTLLKKREKLRQEIKSKLGPLFVYSSQIKNLKNLNQFYNIANEKERVKFEKLLECENESF